MKMNSFIDDVCKVDFDSKYCISDITVCVAIRANEVNPWVLDRLSFLLSYYEPKPKFLVIDFGSSSDYSSEILSICKSGGALYHFVDDMGVFSASKARNIAANLVETDLIFFTDVDFVFDRDIFYRLLQISNDLEIKSAIRRFIPMPIYHLGKDVTKKFEEIENYEKKRGLLNSLSYLGHATKFNDIFEFVAPYSNAFLIHKDFFMMSGGFCDSFRGHGSEDFEFLIRIGILLSSVPVPNLLDKDFYGPLKDSFFGNKDYAGFRRFFEALTAPAEAHGFKAFHLWHEKPKEKGYWTAENDWKRDRFNSIVKKYYPNIYNILNVDYIEKEKNALCLFSDKESWGYFLPLRLYGYKINAISDLNDHILYDLLSDLEKGKYNRVFIFNPYMKSHSKYRGLIELAKRVGVEVTVIERGGLPSSIYYASEVAYGDEDYKKIDFILNGYKEKSKNVTENLIEIIKRGEVFLENQESYELTWKKLVLIRSLSIPKILIPLQLPDDMAVNYFTDGYETYDNFFESIEKVVQENKSIYFIIKYHPLLKNKSLSIDCENLLILSEDENIHALIDICDATVVYNSGVGLLSCIHGKPTFNVGNAYYSTPKNFSNSVSSLKMAIDNYLNNTFNNYNKEYMIRFVDWLINEKYSWFSAESIIREFDTRKSHAYKNIIVERICLDGEIKNSGSRYSQYSFSERSYLGWKIGFLKSSTGHSTSSSKSKYYDDKMKIKESDNKIKQYEKRIFSLVNRSEKNKSEINNNNLVSSKYLVVERGFSTRVVTFIIGFFLSKKQKDKLRRNPVDFFEDSKSFFIRSFKGFYIKKFEDRL